MIEVPQIAKDVTSKLIKSGYRAYYVGGCLRDAVLKRPFSDVDVATNATPDQMREVFKHRPWMVVATGEGHGTMTIRERACFSESEGVEVTTFRKDVSTDGRRATVEWAETIEEDLARRDFTMNALAWDVEKGELVDPFDGVQDILDGVIRSVGNPYDRIREDYLRILRALRFQAQLNFKLEGVLKEEMRAQAPGLSKVSAERKRDELLKMMKGTPEGILKSLTFMGDTVILREVLPSMIPSVGCHQNRYHADDVWTHSILACEAMRERSDDPILILAALLHDVGKPKSKRRIPCCAKCKSRNIVDGACKKCGTKELLDDCSFHSHDYIGAELADTQLRQLKFSNKDRERIVTLVKYHLWRLDSETWESRCDRTGCRKVWRSYYSKHAPEARPSYLNDKDVCPSCKRTDVQKEKISSESSLGTIRRLVRKVGGEEMFNDLLLLREADRAGNRKKRGTTFHQKLAKYMYEAAVKEDAAFKITDLEISGHDLIEMGVKPGPEIGKILRGLLELVLDQSEMNRKEILIAEVRERWLKET